MLQTWDGVAIICVLLTLAVIMIIGLKVKLAARRNRGRQRRQRRQAWPQRRVQIPTSIQDALTQLYKVAQRRSDHEYQLDGGDGDAQWWSDLSSFVR
ncbi:hypothetical protein F4803DRAFT_548511 [Xylaria telfairii]|nr:hypothetical protein F4803DRAFT_548511 [Xylaria telfairii]